MKNIELSETNINAATEILELLTGADDARQPVNPRITFERDSNTLRLDSAIHPLNPSEVVLVDELAADSLGDGWTAGDEKLLIGYLNDNCDFEGESEE